MKLTNIGSGEWKNSLAVAKEDVKCSKMQFKVFQSEAREIKNSSSMENLLTEMRSKKKRQYVAERR
jgi:hypothetical protein